MYVYVHVHMALPAAVVACAPCLLTLSLLDAEKVLQTPSLETVHRARYVSAHRSRNDSYNHIELTTTQFVRLLYLFQLILASTATPVSYNS